jgi:hypothetical protein
MIANSGYSADVSLSLIVAGKVLPLSHVGPAEVSVRQLSQRVEPCNARIVIQVDDRSKILDVYLPNGISGDSYDVAYSR